MREHPVCAGKGGMGLVRHIRKKEGWHGGDDCDNL